MFVAALIVLVIAVLLLLAGIFGGDGKAVLDLGLLRIDANSTAVFFAGMVCLLLFVLGLGMIRSAGRRASSRRKDRKKVSQLSQQLDEYKRENTEEKPAE